jgi:hypothetical protein
MTTRDGPENRSHDVTSFAQATVPQKSHDATVATPKTAPKKAPASRLISTPKAKTDTGIKRTKKPPTSKAKKPPKPDGYTWRRDGSGFELRKSVYETDDTGIRKRRLPYMAHLSKTAFAEMKKRHKGAALEKAIAEWIADHDR